MQKGGKMLDTNAEWKNFLANMWGYAVIITVLSVYGLIILSDETAIVKIFKAGLFTMVWTMILNILGSEKK